MGRFPDAQRPRTLDTTRFISIDRFPEDGYSPSILPTFWWYRGLVPQHRGVGRSACWPQTGLRVGSCIRFVICRIVDGSRIVFGVSRRYFPVTRQWERVTRGAPISPKGKQRALRERAALIVSSTAPMTGFFGPRESGRQNASELQALGTVRWRLEFDTDPPALTSPTAELGLHFPKTVYRNALKQGGMSDRVSGRFVHVVILSCH